MISSRSAVIAAVVAIGIAGGLPSARAASSRTALVIGNGMYTALPALPACLLSAHAVAAALRGAGFDVVEREDATTGGIDAAINQAGRDLAGNPGGPAFVYVCGFATAFNDRAFLLPSSANITRPADVLTQGVLVKSLLGMLARNGNRSAVLALDVVPAPGAPAALGLDANAPGDLPDGLGYIAVSQATPADAATPLAASLGANLKPPTVQIAPMLAAVQQQLAGNKAASIVALRAPPAAAYLVGPPAPPPPAPSAAPPVVAPAPSAAPPVAAAAATQPALPAEAAMTAADRRGVQTVLVRLGYYDGRVDGVFGPDTRAAIRRFQHEIGEAMTGRLTAKQATRLVGGS